MNLLTRERFPKGFPSTASVAKWIGHWSQVLEIESCSRQIHFSLIIESKLSKSTQMSESRNSMQTKSVDHANSGFLKNNQHFEKIINALGLKQCIPGK